MKKRIDPKLPIPQLGGGDTPDPPVKPDGYQDRLNRRLFELFREFDDGTVAIYDEGTYQGQADGLNFIGTNVAAAASTTLPSGIFDITVTGGAGGGGTVDTLSVTASEDVAAGDLINIYSSSGSFRGRKAKASAAGYEAFGWTDSAVLSGNTITVRFLGKNSHSSGLTPGPVFLSDTAGLATSTCPSGSGHVAQQVGVAESASTFAFEWQPAVLLAATHAVGVVNGGYLKTITFTSSGTLTVPANVTGGWLTMVGGGGGGAGGSAAGAAGGGGGAGEVCVMQPIEVVSGAAYTVTIGSGGAGGTAGAAGSDGGDTSLAAVQTWTVKGGKGASGIFSGAGGGMAGAGSVSGTTNGSNGSIESIAFYGGASGGGGGNSTANSGGVGGATGGMNTGAAAGVIASSQAGGGGGGSTIYGLGGAGANGGASGSNASATSYGGGGGGGGGAAGKTNGGSGTSGYLLFMYVG